MTQTLKKSIVNTCTVCILENAKKISGNYNFLPLEKCAEH